MADGDGSAQLIHSLNARINELQGELAETRAEAKKRRLQLKELTESHAELTKKHTDLDTAHAALKGNPTEQQAEIQKLRTTLRQRDYRDAFGAALKDAKGADGKPLALNDGVTIDTLWKATEYEVPDSDPDPKAITEAIGKAATAAPYLFTRAQSGASAARLEKGQGASRGVHDTGGKTVVPVSTLQNPATAPGSDHWKQRFGEAAKAGNIEYVRDT